MPEAGAAVVDLSRSLRQRLSLPDDANDAAAPVAGGAERSGGAQQLCKLFMLGKPHAADCQARRRAARIRAAKTRATAVC